MYAQDLVSKLYCGAQSLQTRLCRVQSVQWCAATYIFCKLGWEIKLHGIICEIQFNQMSKSALIHYCGWTRLANFHILALYRFYSTSFTSKYFSFSLKVWVSNHLSLMYCGMKGESILAMTGYCSDEDI